MDAAYIIPEAVASRMSMIATPSTIASRYTHLSYTISNGIMHINASLIELSFAVGHMDSYDINTWKRL